MFRLPNIRWLFAARGGAEEDCGAANIGVTHGAWGEDVAAEVLRRKGYKILARNARPCTWDLRYEIDIVAYDRETETLTFVEVKQHSQHSSYETRLRSITAHKKRLLRIACNTWRKLHHWAGSYRFDVIQIFGVPGQGVPEVDHIEHVNLFVPRERAVNWSV